MYNTALLINAICRTKDALDFIERELFNPTPKEAERYFDDTDRWLQRLLDGMLYANLCFVGF